MIDKDGGGGATFRFCGGTQLSLEGTYSSQREN